MAQSKEKRQELIAKHVEEMEAQRKREEKLAAELTTALSEKDIYYVGQMHKYMMYSEGKGWIAYQPEAMYKVMGLTKPWEKEVLDAVLRVNGRIKESTAISFNQCDDTVLNFLSTSGWLQPEKGSVHEIFDILLTSVSGGKQENRDHIEQCLVWKYLHPEDYTLPCQTISGGGGGGKNMLIEDVFATIFGSRQVVVLGTDTAFGQYNGQMIGKTIVFIDEAIVEKGDAESLKRKVGNKTISINEKYGLQGTYENTPWYWLGGNGTNGAVMLAKDVTDRRYSVMTIEHSIMYWVCKHLGLELPQRGVVLDGDHPAVKWFAAHKAKLRDPSEVAKWLYSIVVKWGGAKTTPTALHAEDYKKVAVAQKSVFEEAMEHVFLRRDFEHIEGKTLYRIYTLLLKEASPGAYTRGRNKFLEDARDWLAKNRPDVVWEKVKVKTVEMGGSTTTMTTAFRVGAVKATINRNDGVYIRVDDKGRESLRELRVEEDSAVPDTSLVS